MRRADGSRLEVIYEAELDRADKPELAIAAKVNLLVMAGDLRVSRPAGCGTGQAVLRTQPRPVTEQKVPSWRPKGQA